jgi:hypothetical protein
MTSHLLLMIIFALFVSTVFATLLRDDGPGQLRLFGRVLGGMMAGALVIGWLLYPLPF